MQVDAPRLQRICEDVMMDHIGPVAFIVAQDLLASAHFMPNVPVRAQLAAFAVQIRQALPADQPRDQIAKRILDLYGQG